MQCLNYIHIVYNIQNIQSRLGTHQIKINITYSVTLKIILKQIFT